MDTLTWKSHFDADWLGELNAFLGRAMIETYAGNGLAVPPQDTQRKPGFKELVYREGRWLYRDSYTGFLASAGQEVVWYNDSPVWMQSYAGGMTANHRYPKLARDCYQFLRSALATGEKGTTFQPRGPHQYEEFGWRYGCDWSGDITHFWGHEAISRPDQKEALFLHRFFGGVIMHEQHLPPTE